MQRLCLATPDGRLVPLGEAPVTLGRHPENDVRVEDERASRHHCVLEADGEGGIRLRDLGSRNGTRVNGDLVEARPILPGDVIRIGAAEYRVESTGVMSIPGLGGPQPEARAGAPTWASELRRLLDAMPPAGIAEESVTLVDSTGKTTDALSATGEGPRAMRLLLQVASKGHATDIHLEPRGERAAVRMRVDGQMVPIVELPSRVGELAAGLVKAACNMKPAGRDAVLDGHISAIFPDRRVDYRASFTPSMHGQKLVLRILDMRDVPERLGDLGLAPYMYERVKRVCEQDHGLLLVCGPTGSGKTTTLYNALRAIDRHTTNIVTIEDPVEYAVTGVTQIPIDERRGNTFGSLLRSVLRQDPDVILVGEIRDEETVRTAMQAAMTGHVVLSTVHAKDSIAAVFRLLDLGAEPYLVANSLDLVLAQRLVRVLCTTCRGEVPVPPGVASRLGRFLGGATRYYAATGCARCLRTGYRGRRAIFELLDFNDELRDVILREPSIQAMKRVIEQGLFTTLAQSGWRLVGEGVTSLDEVDRVAGLG